MDKLLSNELFVRLLSLALAILIYLQVAGQTTNGNVQRTIVGVPVQTVGLPSNLAVVGTRPEKVDITVSGSAKVINGLASTGVVASVNLAGAKPGTDAYYVQIGVPAQVQPLEATPADVNVSVEPLLEREASLSLDVQGSAAPGFGVNGAATSSPNFVVLRGTALAVDQVSRVVATVDVTGAGQTIHAQVTPIAETAGGHVVAGVQVVPGSVTVTVPIGAATPSKSVQVAPDVSGQPAAGYRIVSIQAAPAAVQVLGPAAALSGVSQVTTQPVSVSGATATVQTSVLVVAPAGAETLTPSSVQVVVVIAKTGSS